MANADERDANRAAFLLELYDLSNGGEIGKWPTKDEVAAALQMDQDTADAVFNWHSQRGHMAMKTFGGSLEITPKGVDEAERLQALAGSAVSPVLLTVVELRAVEAFLNEYRTARESGDLGLDTEAALEADAEVQAIEAQLRSPKPKRNVVRAALNNLGVIALGAAGSATWTGIQALVDRLA